MDSDSGMHGKGTTMVGAHSRLGRRRKPEPLFPSDVWDAQNGPCAGKRPSLVAMSGKDVDDRGHGECPVSKVHAHRRMRALHAVLAPGVQLTPPCTRALTQGAAMKMSRRAAPRSRCCCAATRLRMQRAQMLRACVHRSISSTARQGRI